MRSVRIEFVESRGWRRVWLLAALCCLGLIAWGTWQWQLAGEASAAEAERISALQVQLQKIRTPAVLKIDPRQGSSARAAELLQQDLNKVFATMENLQSPGVQLKGISLDSSSGIFRLEYELDSITKAALVTETLNMGYEQRPWRLDSLTTTTPSGGRSAFGSPLNVLPSIYRGAWSVQLKLL